MIQLNDGYTIQKRRTPGIPGDPNIFDVSPNSGTDD